MNILTLFRGWEKLQHRGSIGSGTKQRVYVATMRISVYQTVLQ